MDDTATNDLRDDPATERRSPSSRRPARRIKVSGRDEQLVLAVGLAAGIGLALRGLSPTGQPVVDWIVLLLAATFAVWASASAPWWALSGVAAVAAAIAEPWLPIVIGLGVFVLSLAVGVTRRSQPVERAIIAAATLLVLSTTRDLGWFGVSTYVSVALVLALAIAGLTRRSRFQRRRAYVAVGLATVVAAVGLLGLAAAAASARPDLTEGNRVARQGLRELEQGNFDEARSTFARAADSFARADDDLGALWAQPARLVPVAAQHRAAGVELADAAASTTRTIEQQLAQIDFDRLRLVDGRIDLDAVRGLQAPMAELQRALAELDDAAVKADDPWLARPIRDELAELRAEIDEQQQLGEDAIQALAVAPAILGADGERVYFVMFTTPAEARGQGGFMGNYAELTITDGRIEMTAFGRHDLLTQALERPAKLERAPEDWLERYADAGFRYAPDDRIGRFPWSNISISPHFPYTAQVIDELYPKSGGRELDGVFSLDVFALEALIGLAGPIEVPATGAVLDGDNAAQWLLVDQYAINELDSKAERIDQLEVVAQQVITRLLTTSPPDPIDLGKAMAPFVRERRLYGWLADEAEQDLIETIDMDGALLDDLDGRDGLAVVVANDGANKLDTFLDREMTYTEGPDGDQLAVAITHDAPVDQLPSYAVGNTSNVPEGWSRLWVNVYTTRPVTSVVLDGEPVPVRLGTEAGVDVSSVLVSIAPGQTQELTFSFGPSSAAKPDTLVVQPQPLVRPATWSWNGAAPIEIERRTEVRLPPHD